MKRRAFIIGMGLAALLALLLPAASFAGGIHGVPDKGTAIDGTAINTMWVVIAAVLVIFMQAGFAFLEIGFSRGKNAGTVVAKILTNFSIAAICYWAVGFAFAFGVGDIIGSSGFMLRDFGNPTDA